MTDDHSNIRENCNSIEGYAIEESIEETKQRRSEVFFAVHCHHR